MTSPAVVTGYSRNGLPYNRFGQGPRMMVIFQGLMLENKPLTGLMARWMTSTYRFLDAVGYTTYLVTRKPGLPEGYTLRNMADDYAAMIREEFGGPVDVIGVSTGGSIALHFAADHPDLVRRLTLHSSAYTLGKAGKRAQLRMGHFARVRSWRAMYAEMLGLIAPRQWLARAATSLAALVLATFAAPKNPADLIITIEAEDQLDFKDRLAEIAAPTLVIAGENDPFYSPTLFRETAAGIPHARLILYKGMGHVASGKQFQRDVRSFLMAESPAPSTQEPAAKPAEYNV